MKESAENVITVKNLTMAYGSYVVMNDLNFSVKRGEIKVLMGGSGCGKSTLLKYLIGLRPAGDGEIYYGEERFDPSAADSVCSSKQELFGARSPLRRMLRCRYSNTRNTQMPRSVSW